MGNVIVRTGVKYTWRFTCIRPYCLIS